MKNHRNTLSLIMMAACGFMTSAWAQQQPTLIATPGGIVITAGGLVVTPNGIGISPQGIVGHSSPTHAPAPYTPPYLPQGGVLGLLGVPVITVGQQGTAPVITPGCPMSVQMIARSWMGQSEYQAINAARLAGGHWRVVRRDGERFAVTQDYSETRINFEFDQDRLTRLSCG